MNKVFIYSKNKQLIEDITQIHKKDLNNIIIGSDDRWAFSTVHLMSKNADIVLIDMNKPYFTAALIVREIKELDRNHKIIVLTDGVNREAIYYSWSYGADAIILKSYVKKNLLDIIESIALGLKILGADVRISTDYYKRFSARKFNEKPTLSISVIKILNLLSKGYSRKEVASILEYKFSFVKYQCDKTIKKLGKSNITDVIKLAKKEHML